MALWDPRGLIFGSDYTILTDALLPFALIFTVVYSVLLKTKILGTEADGKTPRKNFNVIISLIVSLLVVIPHITNQYPVGWDVIEIMNKFIVLLRASPCILNNLFITLYCCKYLGNHVDLRPKFNYFVLLNFRFFVIKSVLFFWF